VWFFPRPDLYVPSVADIDVADLRQRGVEGLIVDLDNTLIVWNECDLQPEVRAWVADARSKGMRLCITSNSDQRGRVRAIAQELGVPFVAWATKPRRWAFRRSMAQMGTTAATTAVVGDQLLTDIWGGRRLGLRTILVKPLSDHGFVLTRGLRWVERWLLRQKMGGED